ncbi:MAG: DUF2953 domain-containing protein [Methanospirillum sp.]|nr:DUF2953 domain-containing protein [Methanospirillum sp.]
MPLLETLAIGVAILAVLALLYLTFVPVVASVSARKRLTTAELAWGLLGARLRLEPGGGQRLELLVLGLPIRVPVPGREPPGTGAPAEVPPPEPEEGTPALRAGRVLERAGDLFVAWPAIQRLLVAVLRETRLRVRLGLVFGTGDAATTGQAFGVLMALRGITAAQPWLAIEATPIFDGPAFSWDADGEVRVRSPLRVMVPAARLLLRPEVRALVREARS